ncbi:ferric reductase-like transmembrane domain-containing protein [Candidatus Micrarchaeota archaeon]|nr:ferric reductase-like transmembrane domain-containing protein [Candidatus Micrarchaeota archaeon]MBI5176967.1 ferric reductase-like transmembrane domain-containing protein [Candidatus Micrarchaeota archaeon]
MKELQAVSSSRARMAALAIFLLLWVSYAYFEVSFSMANKMSALLAVVFIGISLALGPLTRFFPNAFGKWIPHRKFFGILGLALALVHEFLSTMLFPLAGLADPSNPKAAAFYAGLLALLVFLVMGFSSGEEYARKWGYEKWKLVQKLGYLALLLVIVHFVVMELKAGVFKVRPAGQAVLAFAILVILLRLAAWAAGSPEKRGFREHVAAVQTPLRRKGRK